MIYLETNKILSFPTLQQQLGLNSPLFTVKKKVDGGMGTCYMILDSQGNKYALKMIHSELVSNEKAISRYLDEIKKWISFSSCDGIVEAIQVVTVNELPAVVSKWMEGGDMRGIIKHIDKSTFYSCMDRIIVSLKWVYDNYNTIHRDLKPGNILLDKDNLAYVGDWGLAKVLYSKLHPSSKNRLQNPKQLSDTQGFVGTILYASPEQIMGKPDIDFRSDIYSLGCIMYEWETGRPPFTGKTAQEIASSHIYSIPKRLGDFSKNTNFRAEDLILKCLEKDPNKRYQSYEELLKNLRKLAHEQCCDFRPFEVKEKYTPINIGYDEFSHKLIEQKLKAVYSPNRNYALLEEKDIQAHLIEANTLISVGEYEKALKILKCFYIPDIS
ncbi:MAG: serine/threonine-protein kinase, partial [Bacteroidales bacterium]|nr:serine/threonine-protein kinase [Bacteroidales bacterium]